MNLYITIPKKNISHFMKTFQEHNWLKTKIKEDEAHEKCNENETTNQNHEKVNRKKSVMDTKVS